MFYPLGKKFRKTLGGVASTPTPLYVGGLIISSTKMRPTLRGWSCFIMVTTFKYVFKKRGCESYEAKDYGDRKEYINIATEKECQGL